MRPSSAAFLKVSRGKRPVSSSSFASGFTSDSANSRTVFWRSFCSSLSSRFMSERELHYSNRLDAFTFRLFAYPRGLAEERHLRVRALVGKSRRQALIGRV